MSDSSRRWVRRFSQPAVSLWLILAILALAFGLRLINLNDRPMWYDEAFAVLYAEKPFGTMLYGTIAQVEGAAADVHPLFFYSILHAWMNLVGQSPTSVRILSVLLGTATVVMVYLLARRLFGWRIGLAAAAIVTVAPFHIYYSQEVRMYALLGFAATTATYFFVRAWTDNQWIDWAAFGVFGAMTLYAHNLGFAYIFALDLWVGWTWFRPGGPRWQNLRPMLLSSLLMLALFAPWLLVVPSQFGKIQQAYWVERPGIVQVIQSILVFHFAYDNQALPGWLLPPALFFSLLILAILSLELLRRRASTRRLFVHTASPVLVICALAPVLLLFLLSLIRPVYLIRALLPSALVYYVLVAAVLAGVVPKTIRWALLLPAAGIVALSLVNHYGYAEFPRPPFEEVAAYLRARFQPGDVIVHSNKLTFLPTHYYCRDLPQRFIADEPGSPSDTLALATQEALGQFATADIAAATEGHERVWFVIFRRAIDEYVAAGQPDHPHRAWLEEHYDRVGETSFHDLVVYEYRSAKSAGAAQP